jgi:hypothetical protein
VNTTATKKNTLRPSNRIELSLRGEKQEKRSLGANCTASGLIALHYYSLGHGSSAIPSLRYAVTGHARGREFSKTLVRTDT